MEREERIRHQKEFLIKFAYWAVWGGLVLAAVKLIGPVLLPFIAAFFVAWILSFPVVFVTERMHIRRGIAAVAVVLLFYGLAGLLVGFLGNRIVLLGQELLGEVVRFVSETIFPMMKHFCAWTAGLTGETVGGEVLRTAGTESAEAVSRAGELLTGMSGTLLQQVSGLNATTAKNIVAYREEHGAFTARRQVLKVPKLGQKAYEQAAGFLRVPESPQVLDHTGVHPESYAAAETLLGLCGYRLADVGALTELPARLEAYGPARAAEACGIGLPTMRDIVRELCKPGRDPRDELPQPALRTDILELKDLKPGMVLTGTVRNVIDFGVFVDIGVHQDGLVHISQVCNKFIKHPSEAVSVGDIVRVAVLEVDEKRKRISLTMRGVPKDGETGPDCQKTAR